jgi:putative nucleotidyltransferase with HDIG domain
MKTILVVDDMAIFREPIEAVLRADGFKVLTASDGVQAHEAITRQHPDLVLLDLGMPVMDGLAVLQRIRYAAATKHTPVIVLSAESDRNRVMQAAQLGISGFLLKSQFSLKAMVESVKQALTIPEADTLPQSHRHAPSQAQPAKAASPNATMIPVTGTTEPSGTALPEGPAMRRRQLPETFGIATDEALKSLRPLMTRSELLQRIDAEGELTGFSPTVSLVLKITSSATCSMEQVAKAVSQDQTVALKVMRLANSSVYSRGERVDSIHKAVLRIGMANIRQAVLNIGVVERFGSIAFKEHLSTPLFWEHSIACGIIAAELAHCLKHKEPDIAFTGGLLHDLGRVIYSERLGGQYLNVVETARAMQLPLEEVESRLLRMNHAEGMQSILHSWQFPKDLINPIVFHHGSPNDIKLAAPQQVTDILRLGLADRLAHAMMLGSSGNDTIYPTEDHCRILGVDGAVVRRVVEVARQQTDDMKFSLLSQSNVGTWPRRVEYHRAQLTAPFHPLYVSEAPDLDAYRIFCDVWAGAEAAEAPNLAIVHMPVAKSSASVFQQLVNAERDLGLLEIPTIFLSPDRRLGFDEAVLANRRHLVLCTPTSVDRFTMAANELTSMDQTRAAA